MPVVGLVTPPPKAPVMPMLLPQVGGTASGLLGVPKSIEKSSGFMEPSISGIVIPGLSAGFTTFPFVAKEPSLLNVTGPVMPDSTPPALSAVIPTTPPPSPPLHRKPPPASGPDAAFGATPFVVLNAT